MVAFFGRRLPLLHCKHYIPFPNDRLYDMGKCNVHHTFTDKVRKDETKCGIKAINFTV
jgi:hypothetical protein